MGGGGEVGVWLCGCIVDVSAPQNVHRMRQSMSVSEQRVTALLRWRAGGQWELQMHVEVDDAPVLA